MKLKLSQISLLVTGIFILSTFSSFKTTEQKHYSLTVQTNNLRNEKGSVVFALYNREDAFPDQHYKKYYKMMTGKIENHSSSVTFKDLPPGRYAVNILHDEDNNGKIKKGFILPKEGIGFSNYKSIGIGNKPKFSRASFMLQSVLKIKIKMIYL